MRGDCLLCDEDPRPPSQPAPQGFLQSKNALRRTSTSKFAARQHNHQLSCKPVSACKPERECYQKPQKIAPLKGSSNLEPPGFQKGRALLFPKESRGNPFKGFLWAISSRRLDTALLCATKKRGVELNQLADLCQTKLALAATAKSKQAVWQALPIITTGRAGGLH